MTTALKRYDGGRVLVFVVGAFAEMSEDVSCICDIIANDLAWIYVSCYNGDSKRTKGMYRQCIQRAWGHTAHRGWARLLLDRARDLIDADGRGRSGRPLTSPITNPSGGATSLPRRAQPLLLLFRSNPPH